MTPIDSSKVNSGYPPFVSQLIALLADNRKVPFRILSDLGALRTFLKPAYLAIFCYFRFGLLCPSLCAIFVSVHKIFLSCDLMQGEVEVAVHPALPVDGVGVILGINLAGARVWANARKNYAEIPLSRTVFFNLF